LQFHSTIVSRGAPPLARYISQGSARRGAAVRTADYRHHPTHDTVALTRPEIGVFATPAGHPDGETTAIEALPGLRVAKAAQMRPTNESTLRARARKLGYSIHKSRLRSINEDNLGKFALVKEDSNSVVLGERFDASLEEIAEYLS
jgi:hypothetical protein